MDYSKLPLSGRQIRLLTILPAAGGETAQVQCTMKVWTLPTTEPAHCGPLPSHIINFDPCVTNPPEECHVEEMREMWADTLKELDRQENSLRSRVKNTLLYRENAVTLNPLCFENFLSPEEKRELLTGTSSAGLERRIWNERGVIHMFEDEAGYGIMLGEQTPPPRLSALPLREVNPFFRHPDPDPESYRRYLKGVVKKPGAYVALSYAWDPCSPTAEIQVNGATMTVGANLHAGLRRFRQMDYFRLGGQVWIDALCINQDDAAEKAQQLPMMASIYRHAGNVIVWLGPGTNDSERAITFLQGLGRWYRAEYIEAMDGSNAMAANTWRTMAQIRLRTSYEKLRTVLLADGPFLREIAAPVYDFFDRRYWRRLWIIQELCMGRAVMPVVCGNQVTQWRHIRDGVLGFTTILDALDEATWGELEHRRQPLEHSLLHVAQIAQLEIAGHRRIIANLPAEQLPLVAPTLFENGPLLGSPIRRTIALASQSSCKEPHDKIYGLLGVPGLPNLRIQVDYNKPLVEVFTEFTAALVSHGSLDFFALLDGGRMSAMDEAGRPLSQDPEKPSWVPDYASKPARRIGILEGQWHAGGQVPVNFAEREINSHGYLFCKGKIVDTVDGTGAVSQADILSGAMNIAADDDDLRPIRQPSRAAHGDDTAGTTATIYNVLVGGCDRNGTPAPASFSCLYTAFPVEEPPPHSPFYRNWHFLKSNADLLINGRPLSEYFSHLRTPPTPSPSTSTPAQDSMETAAARQAMVACTKWRRLIVTSAGRLGLAPAQTRPGDAVITIVGHGKPVVARKVGTVEGQDLWYLIGEAYVQGLMKGEEMKLSDKPWYRHETEATMRSLDDIPFI